MADSSAQDQKRAAAERAVEEVRDGMVRFTQTAGGRTGVPTPRRVNRPPFVQVSAPLTRIPADQRYF